MMMMMIMIIMMAMAMRMMVVLSHPQKTAQLSPAVFITNNIPIILCHHNINNLIMSMITVDPLNLLVILTLLPTKIIIPIIITTTSPQTIFFLVVILITIPTTTIMPTQVTTITPTTPLKNTAYQSPHISQLMRVRGTATALQECPQMITTSIKILMTTTTTTTTTKTTTIF